MKVVRGFVLLLLFSGIVVSAACTGNSGGKTMPAAVGGSGGIAPEQTASVSFTLKVPRETSSAKKAAFGRVAPQYISANTLSLSFLLNTVNGSTPIPTPTIVVFNVTATSSGCSVDGANPGNFTCTFTQKLPVGSDNATITTYEANNATGNVLSQTTTTFTVMAGVANNLNITLGANPNALTVTGPSASSFVSGSLGAGYTIVGAGPQSFTVGLTDPSGATIVGPGNPTISVTSANTAAVNPTNVTSSGFSLSNPGYAGSAVQVTVKASPAANSGFSPLSTSFNVSQTPLVAIAFYQSGAGQVQLFTPGSGTSLVSFNSTPITSGAADSYAVAFGLNGYLAVGNAAGSGLQESASLYNPTAQASAAPAPLATTASGAVPSGPGNVQSISVYTDGTVATSNNSGISDQLTLYAGGNLSSGTPLTMPSPSAAGYGGKQVVFLPNGTTLVALISGSNAGAVAMVPAGATSCASCSLVTTGVSEPEALTVDTSGNFYVSNYAGGGATSGTITKYNEAGVLQGTVASSLDKPFTLAVSPDGNYASYASGASDNIVTIVSTGSTWTSLCTTTLTGAMRGMAWLPDDTLIASSTGTVGRYNTSCSGTTITIPGSTQGSVAAVSP